MSTPHSATLFDDLDTRPDPALPGTLVRRGAADTSRAAALRAYPRSGTQRERVLMLLKNLLDGLTDDELSAALDLSPNTVRPRRVELVAGGWVKDSGRRRNSAGGSPAVVWVYCPEPGR